MYYACPPIHQPVPIAHKICFESFCLIQHLTLNIHIFILPHSPSKRYGDPAAAQPEALPSPSLVVDAKDTFLDAKHVEEVFGGEYRWGGLARLNVS